MCETSFPEGYVPDGRRPGPKDWWMAHSKPIARALAALPDSWRFELAVGTLEPVTAGMSAASVFRVRIPGAPERYLKIAKASAATDLRGEIERTGWLGARGLRVPDILRVHDTHGVVAAMMSAVPGVTPNECGRPAADIVARLAEAMAAFHALPLAECPYDESVAVRLDLARRDVARGGVDPGAFDLRNKGVTPKHLYRRLAASLPASEDVVVAHGDATFDNVRIDAGGIVGFIDCGRAGRADRYIDLALLGAEIEERFGPEWITPFARAYGLPSWDAGKALWFSDLYELF